MGSRPGRGRARRFPGWARLPLGLLAVVVVVPLLVPYPPARGLSQPQELADPDSSFVTLGGVEVHYKLYAADGGTGGQPVFVLLHGFGASEFSWRGVDAELAQLGTVIAFDRPGFGLTERPMPGQWQSGASPYSDREYIALTLGLMDALEIGRAILVGHSAGGSLAVQIAAAHPERVEALVLEAPALGGGHYRLSPVLRWLASTPQARRIGPWAARGMIGRLERVVDMAWHDPSKLDAETLAGYHRPLTVVNWDRALWEIVIAPKVAVAPADVARLAEGGLPVLFVTGDDDRIVPTGQTTAAAAAADSSELVVVEDCGHIPHEERPEEFIRAVREFLAGQGM